MQRRNLYVCALMGSEFCGRRGIGRSRIGGEEGKDRTDGQIVKRNWGIGSGRRRTVGKGELQLGVRGEDEEVWKSGGIFRRMTEVG